MSKSPIRIPNPEVKAEGSIHVSGEDPIPYDTQLVGPDGVNIHLWMGKRDQDKGLIYRALRLARVHRDIVSATYSTGEPTGFWTGSDIFEDA